MSSSAASSVHSRLRQVSLNPSRTDDIVPYDAHIDPDFPHEAPYARGLYNIPEGHNLDKDVDLDFRTGFRHGPPKSAVSSPQNADPHQLYIPSSFARYLVPSSNGIPQYQPMGYSYGAYVPTPYASYGSYPYQTYAQPSYGYPYSSPYEMG
ncbi:hypothetical protein L596_007475 [Steinernema carpocapsae]|nr:hypothetical protein L596_007475 [Steinernema carpocapsae]